MAGIVIIQGKITSTGVPQQLPSNPRIFKSLTMAAKSTNTAAIGVTSAASGGAVDGTGTAHILEKGQSIPLTGLTNTNALFVTGTAGDVYSLIGT